MNKVEIKATFDCKDRGIYFHTDNDIKVIPFYSAEDSSICAKDGEILIYAFYNNANVNSSNERHFIKIGQTCKSIDYRYNDQDVQKHKEVIVALWKIDSKKFVESKQNADTWIHDELEKIIKKEQRTYKRATDEGQRENFEVFSADDVFNIIQDVENIIHKKKELKPLTLYADIVDLVEDIYYNSKKWNLLYLCPRWGKTRTNLSLCQLYNIENNRITVLFSYVHTVRNSYFSDIYSIKEYNENFKFVDVINYNEDDIVNFLAENNEHHVIIYFRLTSSSEKIETYISNLKKLSKQYEMISIVEEADFGAHCNTQSEDNEYSSKLNIIHKVVKNCKINKNFVCSGTGFDKMTKFVEKESSNDYEIFTRDYITDILVN